MTGERLYIVAYDIGDQKRWRRVFKIMNGYGRWLQLTVFQCRLNARRRAELETKLRGVIRTGDDHVLVVDVGPADGVEVAFESIGRSFEAIQRRATVI